MIGELRNAYISRKLDAWTKEKRRTAELERIPVDPEGFRHDSIERKHELEDWYDLWDSVTPW